MKTKIRTIRLTEKALNIVLDYDGKNFTDKLENIIYQFKCKEKELLLSIRELQNKQNEIRKQNYKMLGTINTIRKIEQYLLKAENELIDNSSMQIIEQIEKAEELNLYHIAGIKPA